MTKSEAAKLVAMLLASFPNSQVSEKTAEVYEHMLSDLDFGLVQRAVARLVGTEDFLPSIAKIRRTATELQRGPVRPGGDAWGEVLEQTREVGYCGTPTFEDSIVEYIVGLWGWREICLAEGPADRARFIELYDRLAKERRVDEVSGVPLPRRLPGASEEPKALTHEAGSERAAQPNVVGLVRQIGRRL